MKESPELFHGVLEGCAGDEDLVVGVELDQGLVQQRLVVLQPIARQCYYDNSYDVCVCVFRLNLAPNATTNNMNIMILMRGR